MSSPTTTPADLQAAEAPVAQKQVAGRSLWSIAWSRLRKDRVAMAGGIIVILIVMSAVFAPQICNLLNIAPNTYNESLISPDTGLPYPTGVPICGNGGCSSTHLLGVEPINGRDILARVLYGGRLSLFIAFTATAVGMVIGVLLGIFSGLYGGWIDTLLSRTMDLMLAFPVLLFSIALLVILNNAQGGVLGLSGNSLNVAALIFVIGFFGWAYIGRVIRGQVLSVREKEFVDASRSLGAGQARIVFKEILPNLIAPILVYATLTIPTNILYEAALSYLGVGVRPPTPSWGGMLSNATSFFQVDWWYMFVPGMAIFVTVMAFNLFGDGLQDAFSPKTAR